MSSVLQAMPGAIAEAPLTLLEAWLGTALNSVAGALFVVGSYTILAGMYSSFAPRRCFGAAKCSRSTSGALHHTCWCVDPPPDFELMRCRPGMSWYAIRPAV